MNTHNRNAGNARQAAKARPAFSTLSVCLGLAMAGLSGAVNAATSFPDHPLQTHAGTVPPNIMFILDDSGSMQDLGMPDGVHYAGNFNSGGVVYAAYQDDEVLYMHHNLIRYDPTKEYKPWRNADGSYWTLGTAANAVLWNPNNTNPTYTVSLLWSETNEYYNRKQLKVSAQFLVLKNSNLNPNRFGNYYRYRYDFQAQAWKRYEWIGGGNDGRWDPRWYNAEHLWGERTPDNYAPGFAPVWGNAVTVTEPVGVDGVPGVPNQLQNFINWFSFHRFRMSVAKAGASEAFYNLGENYRVGYESINNGLSSPYTAAPIMPIPVTNDEGLFRGANKQNWFNRLHGQVSNGWTPLRQALYRIGGYYKDNSAVWTKNGSGEEYSCRRSYAILTTDGYWNGPGGSSTFAAAYRVGNADGTNSLPNYTASRPYMDGVEDSLADVAMHFWKNDLRPSVPNNISATSNNPATWQHMVTFGVSIGLQGTVPPTAATLAEIRAGTMNWSNPITNGAGPRIDDLWHAAVNSRGEFVVASDAQAFSDALSRALDAIAAENGAGGGLGDSGRQIAAGSVMFQGSYQSGTWLGDVKAYDISSGSVGATPLWSFATNSVDASLNFKGRPIFTSKAGGANGVAAALSLTALDNSSLLERTGGAAPVTAAQNLAYIRGDQSLETQNGGTLRNRTTVVGDIINSVPTHVAASNTVYFGANDGMLHAASATDGKPLFSYMPRGIDFSALAELSNPNYTHRFFVDGEVTVSDTATGGGKNILVAPLGRGGKGLFALDVTNPTAFSASNVLWDRTGNGDADTGYILAKPLVLKGNNAGKPLVIVPNGLESSTGRAVVLIYELDSSGKPSAVHKLGQSAGGSGNAMMSVAAADIDQNGTVDYLYGGDIQGNVWKIDISNSSTANWKVSHGTAGSPQPMFVATDASGTRQPITGGMSIAREPDSGRLFVSFGTGKFLADSDKVSSTGATPQTQTLYGLIDDNGIISGRSQLQARTFPYSGTVAGKQVRALESHSELSAGMRGWYLDLGSPASTYTGERIITAPEVVGRAMGVTTLIPRESSGCTPATDGTQLLLDAFTGTNPKQTGMTTGYIDLDGDGQADRIPGAPDGEGYVSSVSAGIGLGAFNFYMKDDGSLVGLSGTYAGGQVTLNILAGNQASGRINWRELVDQN